MSIRRTFVLMGLLVGLVLGGLLLISYLWSENETDLTRSQELHARAVVLARELAESSDLLTRAARDYVMTADPRFEEIYRHVLDVRNGKAPRPDGETVPFRTLLNQLELTPAEELLLSTGEDNSNKLAAIETVAMNAVKGLFDNGSGSFVNRGDPDLELARRLMFGDEYQRHKDLIMDPISEFFHETHERTKGVVSYYQERGQNIFRLEVGLAISLLALSPYLQQSWRLEL